MLAVAVALSLLVGITLGLLGGGGSILMVPILANVLGLDTKDAIATSLLVVGATSAAGALQHARAGNVELKTGLLFGAAGMVGAYAGGLGAAFVAPELLMLLFVAMMVVTAVAMLRPRRETFAVPTTPALPRLLGYGAAIGVVTGLVGAGGGFVVVPALALLAGMPMKKAVGTSLLVITLNTVAGFLGHLGHATIDWPVTGAITAAAVTGSFVGTRLAGTIDPRLLRRAFGAFVLVIAALQLVRAA